MPKSVITFLTETSSEEMQNISLLVERASKIVRDYFGTNPSFDILICRGSWEMEVQILTRKEKFSLSVPSGQQLVGVTDYHLREIVIRFDAAKFGHYLHELIHSIMSKRHSHQLREGLAWYFTEKLTERRYTKAFPPYWVETTYLAPVKKLARIVGDDFLREMALGKGEIETNLLPDDVKELFMSEELFYLERRHKT